MSKDLWQIFYITYGIAGALLVVLVIRGVVKKQPARRILSDLGKPVRWIILSMLLWYATIYISGDLSSRF